MKRLALLLASLLVACADAQPSPAEPPHATLARRAEALRGELVDLRRDLHRHPELSGEESRTEQVIADRLGKLGLEVRTGVGGHGVVGVLRGGKPGPVVAYRSDMDAMPGDEPPGREYGSTIPGVYHVCGHDVHMAVAVGVASALSSLRGELPGTVLFLFQPAEERLVGAQAMIDAGAIDAPQPDVIYALHSFPFRVGTLANGAAFAGLDHITVELLGSAATEETALRVEDKLNELSNVAVPKNAEQVAAYLAALLVEGGPLSQAVYVDVGRSSDPSRVIIRGGIKASSDKDYPALREQVKQILEEEAGPGGYTLDSKPFPSMVSDPEVSAAAAPELARAVGPDNVLTMRNVHAFSGEDFALFLQRTPGAMFLLGVANPERGILGAPHFPDFDADEEAIQVGTRAMSQLIWQRLSQP